MQTEYSEHISNIVSVTRSFCFKLTRMQKYIVVLRSVDHLERIKKLRAENALRMNFPAHALPLDFAIVSLISKFYYIDSGMCSYKAGGARYIQHYTSDERYDHEYMNFLEMLLFRAVDFRLRPTAIFEGFQLSSPLGGETATEMMARSWESPGMQLEISIGDPELGISVQVLEIFDPWQYEQRDPDTPVDWKRFKPRDSIRFAHERNFLVSVTTLLEHTVYQHWAVHAGVEFVVKAPTTMDQNLLQKTTRDMKGSHMSEFHRLLSRLREEHLLIHAATYDASVRLHGRPPRIQPVGFPRRSRRTRMCVDPADTIVKHTPALYAAFKRAADAFVREKTESIRTNVKLGRVSARSKRFRLIRGMINDLRTVHKTTATGWRHPEDAAAWDELINNAERDLERITLDKPQRILLRSTGIW